MVPLILGNLHLWLSRLGVGIWGAGSVCFRVYTLGLGNWVKGFRVWEYEFRIY